MASLGGTAVEGGVDLLLAGIDHRADGVLTEWDLSGQCIGWIDYIGTRPKDRRQGFGQALLRHSLQKLQKQGAEEARLVTISSNLPAVNFYSKAGFRQEPVQEPASYQIKISVE